MLVNEASILYTSYAAETIGVEWDELRAVSIETNDTGPWLTDFYWVLELKKREVCIPQGAEGEDQMIEALLALPSFDHDAYGAAMSSTSNRRFKCWRAENSS